LQAIKKPLDIYFATWKTASEPEDSKGEPIGYFMFVDGGFRWESGIRFSGQIKVIKSNAKFVPAKLVKKVEPVYPLEAAAQHIGGTIRVYYVIGADGAVYNAHAISGEGLSDNPSLRKAAEEAVIQWRYQPATLDGKPIQTNAVTVDITFSPKS
jgi:TonB family protein